MRPSQPGPVTDESLSIGVSSAEPEKTKKHERAQKQKAWKPSPHAEKTKKPKKAKGERAPEGEPAASRGEEAKEDEDGKVGPAGRR